MKLEDLTGAFQRAYLPDWTPEKEALTGKVMLIDWKRSPNYQKPKLPTGESNKVLFSASKPTAKGLKARELLAAGMDRAEVVRITGISSQTAGVILRKMRESA